MRIWRVISTGLALIACVSASLVTPAAAATQSTAGITVSPSVQNISLQQDQDTASFTALISNDTTAAVSVAPVAADFSADGVEGRIRLRNNDPNHGLSKNLQFSPQKTVIPPHGTQEFVISILRGASLSPGGHFAMVRYQASPAQGRGDDSVSLRSELATFVFLNTAGKSTYGVRLQPPDIGVKLIEIPDSVDLLFTNTANTQTAVHGTVSMSGPFGRQIANGVVNENSSLVLPGSTRLLQTPLQELHSPLWPGNYRLDFYYKAEPTAAYTHVTRQFMYIGWPTLLIATGIAALMVTGVRYIRRRLRRSAEKKKALTSSDVKAQAADPEPIIIPEPEQKEPEAVAKREDPKVAPIEVNSVEATNEDTAVLTMPDKPQAEVDTAQPEDLDAPRSVVPSNNESKKPAAKKAKSKPKPKKETKRQQSSTRSKAASKKTTSKKKSKKRKRTS